MKLSPGSSSSASPKNLLSNFSPAGLHVLVVDDDPLCLMVLERMLKQCSYKVTTCNRVSRALHLLRENKEHVDLVLSDVYMPDEDGFKLLEVIGLELDLPVIMMSANGETSVVMQGITHGACDYLIKPVRMEELRNIWQHVVRRKRKDFALKADLQGECDDTARVAESQLEQSSKKRKEKESMMEMVDCNIDDINSLKKARVNWSVQLHQQFVNAVNQLGVEKAVPKRILEIMNVQGLTRENVASHLQKYRLYLKRLSGVVPEPYPIASFQASGDGITGGTMLVQQAASVPKGLNTVKGLNLGAGVGTGAARLRKIDPGTMQSLVQYKSYEQKQVANRAQVLGALGVADQRPPAARGGGLQRMTSLDLSFFLQAQHIDTASSAQQKRFGQPLGAVGAVDDMAVRGVKAEEGEVQGAPKLRIKGETLSAALASSSQWEDANWRQHSRPSTVVVPEDAVSSTNDQQDLSGSNQEVSGGSTGAALSTDTFSDCSLDPLGDLTPGVNLATSLHHNELDISDYLQFEEAFTYQN